MAKSAFKSAIADTKMFAKNAASAGRTVKQNVGKAMSNVANTANDLAGALGEAGARASALGAIMVGAFTNPLKAAVGLLALTVKFMSEASEVAQSAARATGLQGKNLAEAKSQASSLFNSYRIYGESIAESTQTIVGMNNALGNTDYTTQAMAHHITRFSIGAGIGKETSAKIMANMMLAQGATEETAMQSQLFAKDLSNAAGVPINLVMDDLANISDNVSAYLGSNPEKLVRATVEARRLGMSLETTAKVADSLLDFESSIEKEMEAQVLTGKTLNYDRARALALQGDTVGAAKDLLGQVGGLEGFNKMNVVQQKALADSIGMSVTEMKKALGTGEKEADLEEERAKAMEKAQMDQAKGIKIIATMAESLNALFLSIGKQLATIMTPYVKQFMDYLTSPEGKEMIDKIVGGFVKIGKKVMGVVMPAIISFAEWMVSEEGGEQIKGALRSIGTAIMVLTAPIRGLFSAFAFVFDNVGPAAATAMNAVMKSIGALAKRLPMIMKRAVVKMFQAAGKYAKSAGKIFLGIFKKLPIIGGLISFGLAVKKFSKGDFIGAGMEIASGLASFIPGVGTAVSVAIDTASVIRDSTRQDAAEEIDQGEAKDFIYRSGQPIQKFNKGDLLIGGTNLMGGGGGGNTEALLQQIVDLLKTPGQINMDGKKVGEAILATRSYTD